MDSIFIDLFGAYSDPVLFILPLVIAIGVLLHLIRFLFGCIGYDSSSVDIDIFTKPDIQEVKEPEKPKEVIIKPVKMQPVTKAKEVPKFCPYCAGIPDNDERCSYCGIKF